MYESSRAIPRMSSFPFLTDKETHVHPYQVMDSFFKNIFNPNDTAKSKQSVAGRSLGGAKPGKVIRITIPSPNPLGCGIEKSSDGKAYAIIADVMNGSQAESVGLKRGDIICYPDSQGEHEILYEHFIEMAKSSTRPLVFDVRRIDGSKPLNSNHDSSSQSADAYVRRQAMIEAAENRQNANRSKYTLKKPSSSTETASSYSKDRKLEINEDISEETRKAIDKAKVLENQRVNVLGFNVYESAKMSGDQGRHVKTSVDTSTSTSTPIIKKSKGNISSTSLENMNHSSISPNARSPLVSIDPSFDSVWAIFLSNSDTSTDEKKQSVSIIRKVTTNALTKGQNLDDDMTSSKYRRVRLSNPKIMQHITTVTGAVDILMSFGFILSEEEGQEGTSLFLPPGEEGPIWIHDALNVLEHYENSNL